METIFVDNVMEQDDIRQSFNALAQTTFGLDFEPWYQKGYWNKTYQPMALVHQGQVISNASANDMTFMINNEVVKAIQIGTVMTHIEYRHMGLARQIMLEIHKRYENTAAFFYLFCNDQARGFYEALGYQPLQETRYVIENIDLLPYRLKTTKSLVTGEQSSYRQLHLDNERDLDLFKLYAKHRQPLGETFSHFKDEALLLFYATYFYQECLYYSPVHEEIVMIEKEGEQIKLLDALTLNEKAFDQDALIQRVLQEVASTTTLEKVVLEICFTPTLEKFTVSQSPLEEANSTTMIYQNHQTLPENFRFSVLSHA